jgi:DNA-binding MarR family transcriptional regulator
MGSGKTPSETLNLLQAQLRIQATRTVIFHSAVAARLGITITDLSCLNMLSLDGPQTPGRLADRIGITRGGAVTAMIDRLERAGFVRRTRDRHDRRRVLVELEADTQQTVAPLFAGLGAALGEQLADYDAGELETLLQFVDGLDQRMVAAIDELRGTAEPN